MISREKLIEAAARVYGEAGFRGATTRRIADEAGVNEITIFRLFGSKAALIEEAIRARHRMPDAALPDVPVDPERELSVWAAAQLAHLREERVLIRKTMAELEERPEIAPTLCAGWADSERELAAYVRRLRRSGRLVDPSDRTDGCGYKVDLDVAASMLTATLFSDAMGRDIMPELYPQPPERAALLYVRCFLSAIGCRRTPVESQDRRTRSPKLTKRRTVTRTSK